MMVPGIFQDLLKRPTITLAWMIALINVVVFIYSNLFFSKWPSESLNDKLKDKNFAYSLSEMYLQTLDPVEKLYTKESTILMQSLRDDRFWKRVSTFPFKGDAVQIELNRAMLVQFQDEYRSSSQYQLGLGAIETSAWAWITYQFTHASLMHLMSNLVFIFLIISYLELKVGAFWLVSVYLLGGFAGGLAFLVFDGAGSMAMVGASASATSLMAFLLVIQKNHLMPWSYLIAPVPQGYGVIYLPAFFIFPIYLMTDFVAALWDPAGIQSSVAVSAHIGGALFGLVLGTFYLTEQKLKNYFIKTGVISENELTE